MNYAAAREQMVDRQLRTRGIRDRGVLAAMRAVPRHLFVDEGLQARAYDDAPLPIAAQQTISQPYMVALMSELLALAAGERVLEVGTGSGYQTAVLAELGADVFSVERIAALAAGAQHRLASLGYGARVHLHTSDGCAGWPAGAPYDAIVVTAAVRRIPRPLLEQLRVGGRLVLPLGDADLQGLARVRKADGGLKADYYGECRFVKLIGQYGWEE